jgi:hypothetical protein
VKAIETTYAGHRFRSRLEARWAVLFDAQGVRWQYEVEGYECSRRLSAWCDEDAPPIRYLPDFWLPDLGCWAEVKGAWSDEQAARDWLDCAADMSSNYTCPGHPGFRGFYLLGEIGVAPARFHMHEGALYAGPATFTPGRVDEDLIATDSPEWDGLGAVLDVPAGGPLWPCRISGESVDRARKARFERGEHA